MQIITLASIWWSAACLLAGLAYARLLYKGASATFSPAVTRLLFVLRTTVVAFICFLLLSPVIRSSEKEVQRPVLILAEDNSESVLSPDSSVVTGILPEAFAEMEKGLSEKYEIHRFSFSDSTRDGAPTGHSGQQTDLSGLVSELNTRFENRNVGALVVASDGIYNKGGNPLYSKFSFNAPLYTIALGDTAVRKDVLIAGVNHNKVVFLGNSFPLEINLDARQCAGAALQLTVKDDSVTLFARTVNVAGNRFRTKVPVVLDARKQGVMRLKVAVTPLSGEITTANNQRDVFIEVRSSKENVLLLGNAPHPDLGAMKEILESTGNYEVKVELAPQFNGRISDYQLVVMHNLPSREYQLEPVFKSVLAAGIPIMYVVGAQTDPNVFSRLGNGLTIQTASPGKTNTVSPAMAPVFSLFNLEKQLPERLSKFPPLVSPFGDFRLSAQGSVLLYQRIGAVTSQEPLLVFVNDNRTKAAFLCGEGFWRWPLMESAEYGDASSSRDLLLKSIQFLSVKEDRSRFRVRLKNTFNENEPVVVDAELYNDNFELVNTPDVSFDIIDKSGKKFPFLFSKTERSYVLEAGFLPPGVYKYAAAATLGERKERVSGEFAVLEVRAEQTETVADHQLLMSWAQSTGGSMYYPDGIDRLIKELSENDSAKSVSYSKVTMKDMVDLPWVFFFLLLLLGGEWLIRKRSGSY